VPSAGLPDEALDPRNDAAPPGGQAVVVGNPISRSSSSTATSACWPFGVTTIESGPVPTVTCQSGAHVETSKAAAASRACPVWSGSPDRCSNLSY
jgi:hypothetical protein